MLKGQKMFTRARDFEVVVEMFTNAALVTCPRSNAILLALNDLKEIWTYPLQFGFQARVLNGCKDPLPSTGLQVPLLSGTTLLTRTIAVPTMRRARRAAKSFGIRVHVNCAHAIRSN